MSGKAKIRRVRKRSVVEVLLALPAPDPNALIGKQVTIAVDKNGRATIKA